MNELTRQVQAIWSGVWRHRWLGISVAWMVALVGVLVVLLTPERHEAKARIFVDTQTVLKPLMQGLAFQPDIEQQVRMLGKTLISRPNVEKLVNDPAIGLLKNPSPAEVERTIDVLMKDIKVELTGGNNMYAISYRDTDAQRAQKLVETLVNLFMDSGADNKRRDSQEASRFIDEQIKTYEGKLSEAEGRLKDFKLKNFAVATASNNDYFARMSALSDDVARLRVQLAAAEQSRDALRRELASEEPLLPVSAASSSSLTPELDARLDASKRQLDELLRRFTDEHPDVIALRRNIGQLEAERRREADAMRRSFANHGRSGPAPTSPVFQRLRVSLAEAEANVASLRAQLGTQQARLEETKAQAGRVPQAEAELAQLNRDYEIMKKNYEQLVSRREAASLGVKIDQTSSMADFRLIEPPRVSPTAVFPSKQQLALLMTLVALLLGIGAAYLRSALNPTFASERDLRELSRRPVLGSLSLLSDARMMTAARQDRLRLFGALGAFLIAHAMWVAWVTYKFGS